MTDYPKALAAAREAHTYVKHRGMTRAEAALGDLLAAIDAAPQAPPAQPVPAQEPLFLLHTGAVCGNEREDWEVEANNGDAVEAYCDENPGKVVGLYLAPQAPPAAVAEGVQRHPMYVGMRNRLTSELVRRFELAGNEFARAKAEALVSEYQSALAAALAARKGVES